MLEGKTCINIKEHSSYQPQQKWRTISHVCNAHFYWLCMFFSMIIFFSFYARLYSRGIKYFIHLEINYDSHTAVPQPALLWCASPPPDYCIIFQVVGVLKEGIFSNCVLMRCVHLAELGRRSRWTPAICSTWKSSRPVRSMRTVLLTASPDLWSPVFSPFLAACDGQSESYHHTTPECHVSHMPSPIKNTIIPKYHIF